MQRRGLIQTVTMKPTFSTMPRLDSLDPAAAHSELIASLEAINTSNPPVHTCSTGWKFHGFYGGPTSIAYLFYRLHPMYPGLEFKGQSLLDWAEAYLDLSAALPKPRPDPDHCGIANETLAYYSLRAVMRQDLAMARTVCSFADDINAAAAAAAGGSSRSRGSGDGGTSSGSDEWLYGRAGYLYFLRLLGTSTALSSAGIIGRAVDRTVDRILAARRPWTWHGRAYAGAAHGAVGILAQVLLSDRRAATRAALEPVLRDALRRQLPSGNFPSSLTRSAAGGDGDPEDRLVQFCHGGPGFILSLLSIRPLCPPTTASASASASASSPPRLLQLQDEIDSAVARARADVWTRGRLIKMPCLCHGIAGNALALDAAGMELFLRAMTKSQMMRSGPELGWSPGGSGRDATFSDLYTGEAGRAWAWAVLDSGAERLCIGFNDL